MNLIYILSFIFFFCALCNSATTPAWISTHKASMASYNSVAPATAGATSTSSFIFGADKIFESGHQSVSFCQWNAEESQKVCSDNILTIDNASVVTSPAAVRASDVDSSAYYIFANLANNSKLIRWDANAKKATFSFNRGQLTDPQRSVSTAVVDEKSDRIVFSKGSPTGDFEEIVGAAYVNGFVKLTWFATYKLTTKVKVNTSLSFDFVFANHQRSRVAFLLEDKLHMLDSSTGEKIVDVANPCGGAVLKQPHIKSVHVDGTSDGDGSRLLVWGNDEGVKCFNCFTICMLKLTSDNNNFTVDWIATLPSSLGSELAATRSNVNLITTRFQRESLDFKTSTIFVTGFESTPENQKLVQIDALSGNVTSTTSRAFGDRYNNPVSIGKYVAFTVNSQLIVKDVATTQKVVKTCAAFGCRTTPAATPPGVDGTVSRIACAASGTNPGHFIALDLNSETDSCVPVWLSNLFNTSDGAFDPLDSVLQPTMSVSTESNGDSFFAFATNNGIGSFTVSFRRQGEPVPTATTPSPQTTTATTPASPTTTAATSPTTVAPPSAPTTTITDGSPAWSAEHSINASGILLPLSAVTASSSIVIGGMADFSTDFTQFCAFPTRTSQSTCSDPIITIPRSSTTAQPAAVRASDADSSAYYVFVNEKSTTNATILRWNSAKNQIDWKYHRGHVVGNEFSHRTALVMPESDRIIFSQASDDGKYDMILQVATVESKAKIVWIQYLPVKKWQSAGQSWSYDFCFADRNKTTVALMMQSELHVLSTSGAKLVADPTPCGFTTSSMPGAELHLKSIEYNDETHLLIYGNTAKNNSFEVCLLKLEQQGDSVKLQQVFTIDFNQTVALPDSDRSVQVVKTFIMRESLRFPLWTLFVSGAVNTWDSSRNNKMFAISLAGQTVAWLAARSVADRFNMPVALGSIVGDKEHVIVNINGALAVVDPATQNSLFDCAIGCSSTPAVTRDASSGVIQRAVCVSSGNKKTVVALDITVTSCKPVWATDLTSEPKLSLQQRFDVDTEANGDAYAAFATGVSFVSVSFRAKDEPAGSTTQVPPPSSTTSAAAPTSTTTAAPPVKVGVPAWYGTHSANPTGSDQTGPAVAAVAGSDSFVINAQATTAGVSWCPYPARTSQDKVCSTPIATATGSQVFNPPGVGTCAPPLSAGGNSDSYIVQVPGPNASLVQWNAKTNKVEWSFKRGGYIHPTSCGASDSLLVDDKTGKIFFVGSADDGGDIIYGADTLGGKLKIMWISPVLKTGIAGRSSADSFAWVNDDHSAFAFLIEYKSSSTSTATSMVIMSASTGQVLRNVSGACGFTGGQLQTQYLKSITTEKDGDDGDKTRLLMYGNRGNNGGEFVVCMMRVDAAATPVATVTAEFITQLTDSYTSLSPAHTSDSVEAVTTRFVRQSLTFVRNTLFVSGNLYSNLKNQGDRMYALSLESGNVSWSVQRARIDEYNMPVALGSLSGDKEHVVFTVNGILVAVDPATQNSLFNCGAYSIGCQSTPAVTRDSASGAIKRAVCIASPTLSGSTDWHSSKRVIALDLNSATPCAAIWALDTLKPTSPYRQGRLSQAKQSDGDDFAAFACDDSVAYSVSFRASDEPAPSGAPTTQSPTTAPSHHHKIFTTFMLTFDKGVTVPTEDHLEGRLRLFLKQHGVEDTSEIDIEVIRTDTNADGKTTKVFKLQANSSQAEPYIKKSDELLSTLSDTTIASALGASKFETYTATPAPPSSSSDSDKKLIIYIAAGCGGAVLLTILIALFCVRKKRSADGDDYGEHDELNTQADDEEQKYGYGGFN